MSAPEVNGDLFWRYYREERRKIAPKKGKAIARPLSDAEIIRCARMARKRVVETAARLAEGKSASSGAAG